MTYKRLPDRYSLRAKKEGFAARSVYKLEEIDRRLRLVRPGLRVLDLGAAPGSWTQYVSQRLGPRGKLVALDLEPLRIALGPNVDARVLDAFAPETAELLATLGPFDVVLSDMAPKTTGVRDGDVARSEELVERATELAAQVLAPGGTFVAKVFQGQGFDALRAKLRGVFKTVRVLKPEAVRRESTELYLVGLEKKP